MLKTIFVCGIFFVSSAYAVEQKVYSASELEKIAEGVFGELNLGGGVSSKKIEVLTSPAKVNNTATIKKIEKAMTNKTVSDVSGIYKLVVQASQPTTELETPNLENVNDTSQKSVDVAEPKNEDNAPVKTSTEPTVAPSISSESRLDNWFTQQGNMVEETTAQSSSSD